MNVWDATIGGPRPKGYKPRNTSKPPRTRAGQTYPGGRPLRRALKRLAASMAFYDKPKRGKGGNAPFTKPGSMKP